MKISLNWIKEYAPIKVPLPELLDKIGAQLGAVEEVIDLGSIYKGIVVAKVINSERHPNADKLKVCLIDDGGVTPGVVRDHEGLVQVVCGAPNVNVDQIVAWIPPGVTVPSTVGKDPFVLEAREIRGQMSNGMLGSPHELGVSDDHDGILVMDGQVKRGTPFAEALKLNDTVIDIENKMFTHRPDCFGIIGVAREIAGIQHEEFRSPDWYTKVTRSLVFPASDNLKFEVDNQLPDLCPRFMAITLKDVQVRPSPQWLQSYLSRVGIRPISNIVDITNYLMYLTGQPLHAYDYDKILAQSASKMPAMLVVRHPLPGEKITLLNGKEIEPRRDAVMIASATKLVGVGGVMGGADTEVDNRTRNVILECANFDMYSIRRTSMEHGLFTDAVTRYNKGQSPLQNDKVLSKAVEMVQELAEGTVGGRLWDEKSVNEDDRIIVTTNRDFINVRLGSSLSVEEMAVLLRNVEFVVETNRDDLKITVPFWRTDIEIPEDIVEEVGRLYGFDQLPLTLPARDLTPTPRDELIEFKANIRERLAKAGANESLNYSFVHEDLLTKNGQNKGQAFRLSNALSPELQYYRLSLTPSLLEKVHPNLKSDYFRTGDDNEFALFEIGKTHVKNIMDTDEPDLPAEHQRVALTVAADEKTAKRKYSGAAYYQARLYLQDLLDSLHISWELIPVTDAKVALPDELAAPFEQSRSAIIATREGAVLGVVGEYKDSVRTALKLPAFVAGFELGVMGLMNASQPPTYKALSKFPKVVQDISLKVKSEVTYYNTLMTLVWALPELAPKDTTQQIVPLDIYQNPVRPETKTYTFRLWISSFERTLTAEEVNRLLNDLASKARDELGAERV